MKRIWIDREKCLGCKSCELQCAIERDSVSKTLLGAIQETPKPIARVGVCGSTGKSFPLQCRQCQDASCIRACPAGAMQRDEDTEAIFLDQAKCRGCWMCVMSCPFGVIVPSDAYKVAVKCDACIHMEEPACVNACPTGALSQGDGADFQKILLKKRGRLALFALQNGGAHKVSLEFVGEDDKL
ncbi:4Fe-4S dicluster domain-containing protein [Sporomusa sp.]|uniref:4Fe-4S dicluster domain-containing protein n=1 Tax=Sporomusa sp. TaxID=2078658 RepID=UPI002C8F18E7|nr:4Fe-4S dicluster domain-containing protein [Sporomusa sp.]HWR07604.1 4Fe-4S dicluster domain-containing protein [Sporomusa sp.]